MAKVEKTTEKEVVTTEVEVERFVLTLSREEAEILSLVVGNLTGEFGEGHPRFVTDRIYDLLSKAGVESHVWRNEKYTLTGTMRLGKR